MDWTRLADKSLNDRTLSEEEAQQILDCPDLEIFALVDAAYRVRRERFGRRVKLNFLLNAKSGLCPEDCFYCSQSKKSQAAIDKYPFLSETEILSAADRAAEVGAKRFCMVNSGRGPTAREVEQVSSAVRKVKERHPRMEVCVCLGLLNPEQARDLKGAGVDAYNHNLNTTERHYSSICSTHTYADRMQTVRCAQDAGLSSCSGCLLGMGESDADVRELARAFRSAHVDSIPINFLIPIEGTPLAGMSRLTPQRCLKILALFRFQNPRSEIRIAGGREVHLRWLQPLGLAIANSIFIGDYLTTKGQPPQSDLQMIRDLGFEVEGEGPRESLPSAVSGVPDSAEPFAVRLK